tara:strand:- start:402 stop:974 length:573 start_codon:yes stop_codon:yes gene_type:complete
METFPYSPLPAGLTRAAQWNESIQVFDSGVRQAITPYKKPLYNYGLNISKMNEISQAPLWAFWNARKGMIEPFLMKDPYDYRVNSIVSVRSGINAGTVAIYDTNSWTIRPDSTTVGSMFSALSGYITLGVEYTLDQDEGILTVVTKDNTDIWRCTSMQYFRKVAFASQLTEKSLLYNIFQVGNVKINEIL